MNTRRLDDQIRDFYGAHRLSDEARARLSSMIESGAPPKQSSRWWWLKTGVAAAFVLLVTAGALWFAVLRGSDPRSPADLSEMIVRQAALSHHQEQELDFRADRAAELRRDMKSLDFTPVEPDVMARMEMHLVGARYTTIEGVMAAQIRYLDSKGEACTLYQARPVDHLAYVPEGHHVVDGLLVSVWREKGLLMILARPAA